MPKAGEIIKFGHVKALKYLHKLGSGGTGDAHLFLDETTDMHFAIKKYLAKDKKLTDDYYIRFVDEIKILFTLSHQNIVRIYNYYLYPSDKAGFLQMEYIVGESIDKFEPTLFSRSWDDFFEQAVSAFRYLEQYNILHRDIRPSNILIDKDEMVKIIDFGFGKQLRENEDYADSILLNWPVSEFPEEVSLEGIYNIQSEVYFLGKLFQSILKKNDVYNKFKHFHIIEKMTKVSPRERYKTFGEVSFDISQGVLSEIDFSENQKSTYLKFADALSGHLNNYIDSCTLHNDISFTLKKLAEIIRSSALEEFVQDNTILLGAFIKSGYSYKAITDIKVEWVRNFYKLVNSLEQYKQQIVFDNIHVRLKKIKVVSTSMDDVPF